MKAAVLYGYNQEFKIEDVEKPRPVGNEVLVRVKGSGVCHSDLHLIKGEFSDELPVTFPFILGHEVSGIVEEVGDSASSYISEGTEVLVYSFYCMEDDRYALTGLHQICGLRTPGGIIMYNGGYAEYMLVPHYRYLIKVDGIRDLASAAILSDAGLTAYRAVKKASRFLSSDEYILIIGLGGTGMFGLETVRKLLPNPVVAVDINPDKLRLANELIDLRDGMDFLIDASKVDPKRELLNILGGESPKAVIDFVGLEKTISTYLDLVAPGGVYVLVGLGNEYGPPIPIHRMVINEISIQTVLYGSLMELYELGQLGIKGVIEYWKLTEHIKLEEINEAFKRLEEGRALKRQIIVF